MSDSTKAIEFGVLMPPSYQWLDAAGPIDYINSHSYNYFESLSSSNMLPADLLKKAPVINWHWISTTGDLQPVTPSAGPIQYPTTTLESCPQLDYLLVPGPDPSGKLSNEFTTWLKAQFPGLKLLLTVCTGSLFLAPTGLLDGVQATGNKFTLKFLAEKGHFEPFSKVKWVKDKRFVKDGKIWTAAGVTAGLDLGVEFAKTHFDPQIVEITKALSEYNPNPAEPDSFAYILEGVELK